MGMTGWRHGATGLPHQMTGFHSYNSPLFGFAEGWRIQQSGESIREQEDYYCLAIYRRWMCWYRLVTSTLQALYAAYSGSLSHELIIISILSCPCRMYL